MNSFWNNLPRPFFALAPMEAVTDVVFRHVVRRAGPPDVFFTEFANATGWVHAGDKAIRGRLIKTYDEHPIVAQIWGGEPGDMETFAKHCATLGYDGVDINMGCPAKSAIKSGGSALIRKPEVAVAAIAAAKTAGLPVSVKTRLGYTYVEEWREWIATLLQQDIAALTIHLRTKKEMSKVPAHYELIGDLVALRDEIAPRTLLIINGDIRDREHGEQLARENPGVDGFMIGRGVFHDPFCFTACTKRVRGGESHEASAARVQPAAYASETRHEVASSDSVDENNTARKQQLLDLLRLHLDLYDQWHYQTGRPYETLKRFYKIYIRDFDGASDLRHQLMQTKSTDEVRAILDSKNI